MKRAEAGSHGTLMTFDQFADIFRDVASLGVVRDDFHRFDDVVTAKLYDLLLVAQESAAAQHRHIVEPTDLPITRGLQENIGLFRELGPGLRVDPIVERLADYPPLDGVLATETRSGLPDITGGLSVALARTFRIVYPELRTVRARTTHWSVISTLVDLYL
ncbi:DUF1931 family protein [Rhodococcus jostii]|uniref:DUF1931 family protein n=1 Tax=Rhodococcus jostii TaxID=132919 RepID=A0ABU4CTE5_RHOJO|nr:DUF1931 family protein [Rhodococcus jostii]MDV6286850.1 DUF1931 family protein [Rhodococcus jostii]